MHVEEFKERKKEKIRKTCREIEQIKRKCTILHIY